MRWLVWSVSRPGVATSRSTPRCSSAAWRLNDMPPTTEVTVRPERLGVTAARASTTCWASSRVGTSTRPRGRRGLRPAAVEPGQQREAEGQGLARAGLAAAEQVAPGERLGEGGRLDRERRGEAARGRAPAARARAGRARRSDGMPVSGTVHSTSGGIAAARAGAGPPVPREPRDERVGRRPRGGGTTRRSTCAGHGERRGKTNEPPGRGTSRQEVAAPRWRRLMITPDEPGRGVAP